MPITKKYQFGGPSGLAVLFALFIVGILLIGNACALSKNTNTIYGPTPVASPSAPAPSPTQSASPGTGSKTSDVDSLFLGFYGDNCGGAVKNDGTVPSSCSEANVTATPKTASDGNGDGKNDDAKDPSRELTWRANGVLVPDTGQSIDAGVATVIAGPQEFTFNRTIKVKSPRVTGSFQLEADYVDSAGKLHAKVVTVTVQ